MNASTVIPAGTDLVIAVTDNPFADGAQASILDDLDREPKPAIEKPKSTTAGIQRLTSAEYHADPAPNPSLSATLAKIILAKSPLHAWHQCRRLNPNYRATESKTFDIGTAAHRAILGAGDDYVVIPEDVLDARGGATTAAAKAFVADARAKGLTPLKQSEAAGIEAMRAVAHDRLAGCGITLDPARSEMAAIVEIDGIWCRALFDNAPEDGPLFDFKTCEDATPEACLKSILNYGYHVQAGHYQAVWKAATGEDRPFVFIFQEKSIPYEVTLITLSGSFQHMAERRAAKARRLWADCIAANKWPGFPAGVHTVDPPAWLIERELQEDF